MRFPSATTVVSAVLWSMAAAPVIPQTQSTVLMLAVVPQCSIAVVSTSPGEQPVQRVGFRYILRTSSRSQGNGNALISARFSAPPGQQFAGNSRFGYQSRLGSGGAAAAGNVLLRSVLNSELVIGRFGAGAYSSRGGDAGTLQFTVDPPPSEPLRVTLSIGCQ